MMRKTALAIASVLLGAGIRLAQLDPGVVIAVEARDHLIDIGDPAKSSTEQKMTPGRPPANFDRGMGVGDIVSVNGSLAKGTLNYVANILAMNSIPTPGQALVDSQSRGAALLSSYDIQDAERPTVRAVFHDDLSPSLASPATEGELLAIEATGMGPVRPSWSLASNSRRRTP